jgi:Family of unknown function (DUF6807)
VAEPNPTTLATLRLADTTVAEYVDGRGLDPVHAPRPHLHPVRTLGGVPVTDAQPSDHPWHLGLSVAVQDVDGWNLWGGPTYLRDRGYTARPNHGRIEHSGFAELRPNGFVERLRWLAPSGEPLLVEERVVHGRLVEHGWELRIGTALTNATDRGLRLGSPATHGRIGAGYGASSGDSHPRGTPGCAPRTPRAKRPSTAPRRPGSRGPTAPPRSPSCSPGATAPREPTPGSSASRSTPASDHSSRASRRCYSRLRTPSPGGFVRCWPTARSTTPS